ncbi:MAG: hypothetical protein IPJ78_19210 [Gemmatimonadetes bacterium]|nr:hypothetical protein [Gemmatimonadota bacterium]
MTPASIRGPWQRRARAVATLAAAGLAFSFLACGGDGPTAVPELDLAQSTLFVAAGPYVAGQTYTATLTARNAKGEPFTDPISATLSLVNGTSGGTFSAITSSGTGTYSSTLTAVTAGTPSQVRAVVAGEGELTSAQSITIVPGPASAAASLVVASLTSVPVGGAATVTVTARDANNNVRTSGGDAVVMGLGATAPGGGQLGDGTLSAVTDQGNGTYTATFTGTRWGVRAITASINGAALTGSLPAITVQMPPPATAQSTIVLGRTSLAAGDTTTALLELRDPQGNRVTWTGVTVTFTKGTGTSDGTFGAVVDRGDGTYASLFTATTPGSARAIGATISGAAVTSPSPSVTVSPGALSLLRSAVTVGADTLAAGAQTTLTLTARDGLGNSLGAGGLVVVFTKGAGTSDGTIGAVTDHGNGTYSASFTATTSGTARSIGATVGGAPVTSASPTITVRAGALSLATTTLTAGATALVSGAQTTLTVTARDSLGNAITTGGATVALVKGTGTSDGTLDAVADQGDGTYVATFTGTTAGTARAISATVGGAALTSPTITITVTPGEAAVATSTLSLSRSTLLIGDTATLELTARDAAGNLVGAGGAAVAFTKGAGTSDGTIGAVADLGDGRYRATFTAVTAGSARTIGATIGGVALATPSVSVTVSSVPPSLALSSVTVGAPTVTSGATTTLTLTVRDSAGAVIPSGGRTVAFTLGDGTSTGTIGPVTDQGDGTYSATFTGVLAGSPRAIGATIDDAAVTAIAPTITVTPGAASVVTSTLAVGAVTLASGAVTEVTLTTRDAAGNALTSGGLAVTFTLGGGSAGGTFSAVTDQGDGTYRATFTATVAGSARTIGATIGGVALTSALPTITVTAGAASLTRSRVQVGTDTLASGDSTTLSLVLRDAAGNALGAGGLTVAFVKGDGTSDGVIGAVTDVGDGTYTAFFRATTAGTARAIGATIGGEAIAPDTVAGVTVRAGAISPETSTLTIGSDTVIAGDTTSLVLTARDAAGNLLGAGGATVVFTKGSGTADGTISAVTDVGDGTYRAVFTALTTGAPRAIGVTIGGVAGTMAAPTLVVRPGRFSFARSEMVPLRDTLLAGDSLVVSYVTRDSLGNRLEAGGLEIRWNFLTSPPTPDSRQCLYAWPRQMLDRGDGTYGQNTFVPLTLYEASTYRLYVWVAGEPGFDAECTALDAQRAVVVLPGPAAAAQSAIEAAPVAIGVGATSTVTVLARDAYGNRTRSGGDTVTIVADTGTSAGVLSPVTDRGDGTYTAAFTGTVAGTPRFFRASINGSPLENFAVASVVVLSPDPDMAIATDSVGLLAQLGGASPPVLVAVANAGTGAITGLTTSQTHVSGPNSCATRAWLNTPTFDKGGVADPVSVMTLVANATGLELGVCVRRLIVSSNLPAVQPETLLVSLDVGRNPVATGLVNVVMMGNASSNTVQTITPTPVLRIDNGGRGTVGNLTATIVSQTGVAECTDSLIPATCVPWLAPGDLVFSSPTLPSTLSIVSQVRPFTAGARVRVAGTGMPARDFDINVVFNVLPELVTNPRAAMFRVRREATEGANGTYIRSFSDTLLAFNQNIAHPGLTNYRLDPSRPLPYDWTVSVTPFGNSARIVITADAYFLSFPNDTVVTSADEWSYRWSDSLGTGCCRTATGGIRLLADCTDPDDCFDFGADSVVPKSFEIPWTVSVSRGLALPYRTLEVAARDTSPITVDVPITNLGAGAITGLNASGLDNASDWVSGEFLGGTTAAPAVLRLTIRPALAPPIPTSSRELEIGGVSTVFTGRNSNLESVRLLLILHRRFP